jgi:hypothetical protein
VDVDQHAAGQGQVEGAVLELQVDDVAVTDPLGRDHALGDQGVAGLRVGLDGPGLDVQDPLEGELGDADVGADLQGPFDVAHRHARQCGRPQPRDRRDQGRVARVAPRVLAAELPGPELQVP